MDLVENKRLNPNARSFIPKNFMKNATQLQPMKYCLTDNYYPCANVYSLPVNLTNDIYISSTPPIPQYIPLSTLNVSSAYSPNPYADIFITLHTSLTTGLCAMIALYATLLILSAFILNESFNKDGKQDIEDLSPRIFLRNLKLKNANKIVIGHLNINSIRNKFDCFKYLIDGNIDIIIV